MTEGKKPVGLSPRVEGTYSTTDKKELKVPAKCVSDGWFPMIIIAESTGDSVVAKGHLTFQYHMENRKDGSDLYMGILRAELDTDVPIKKDGYYTFSLSCDFIRSSQEILIKGVEVDTCFSVKASIHQLYSCNYCIWPLLTKITQMVNLGSDKTTDAPVLFKALKDFTPAHRESTTPLTVSCIPGRKSKIRRMLCF